MRLFLEEADKMGNLNQILDEAGFLERNRKLEGPKFVSTPKNVFAFALGACQSLAGFS